MTPNEKQLSSAFRTRQSMELRILRTAIASILSSGYTVTIYDGEETVIPSAQTVRAILSEMRQTDIEHVCVLNAEGKRIGWFQCVYGNDGYDVIADCTLSITHLLTSADALADKLAG